MIFSKKRVRGTVPAPVFLRFLLGFVLLVLIFAAAAWVWTLTVPALSITQAEDGSMIFQAPMDKGGRFSLSYIHSIHRTPVTEHFYINDRKQMVLDAMEFESYGVGMPSSLTGNETFRMENGKMMIENIGRPLERFDLRIGQVIADHKLIVGGEIIPLSQIGGPGSAVRFEISNLNIGSYLKGVLLHGSKPKFVQ